MRNETVDDGAIVVGARCTTDGCEWGPLGTDDPARSWDIVERLRTEHEEDTGHRTTVECVEQWTILRDRHALGEAMLNLAEQGDDRIEWVCPECERTADEMGEFGDRCPDCDEPFREALP